MNLLQEILAYCERTGTRESYLGRKTVGDSTIIREMRKGRCISDRNAARIRAMMAKHSEGMHTPRPVTNYKDGAPNDSRTPWEVAADNRAGSERLREATIRIAPVTEPHRKLSFEEQLALVASGKVGLVNVSKPQAAYSYSLTGGSL